MGNLATEDQTWKLALLLVGMNWCVDIDVLQSFPTENKPIRKYVTHSAT